MAILAGLDREFAFNNPAAPATNVAPKPHVDGKDPRYIERWLNCQISQMDLKFLVVCEKFFNYTPTYSCSFDRKKMQAICLLQIFLSGIFNFEFKLLFWVKIG